MKHRFYNKSKSEQNKIQSVIVLSALAIKLLSIFLSWKTGIYLIAIFTFPIVLSLIASFIDTPSMKKSGRLIYYSPLFITEKPKNDIITIHGGTLFDYVFVINKKMTGKQSTDFIIQQYLEGLLSMIETYEDTKNSDLRICGTSYIINQRTAERIGLKIVKTDYFQKMILLYNYFNIFISNSIAKNKIAFPNLNKTKTFETDLKTLIEHKVYIAQLNQKLESSIAKKV